jgi:hypothetical protein
MTLSAEEFLRRFCLHVRPKGFVRIRFYGLLAPRCRTEALSHCGARSTRVRPRPPRPLPETRPRPCPCLRVPIAVGPWSSSNDSPHARSPCRPSSKDFRLTPRDPHAGRHRRACRAHARSGHVCLPGLADGTRAVITPPPPVRVRALELAVRQPGARNDSTSHVRTVRRTIQRAY